jgi:VanZ family protein
VGDEVFQAILPYRTGSIQDVALNLASAMAGYFMARRWLAAAKK